MGTEVAVKSRAEVFVGEILPPEREGLVLGSLPAHVKPERYKRNLVIAVTQHPKLLDCDPVAVFNEVSKAAALGLFLDPQLGEAYLITGWDGRNNRPAPQLRLGYRGLIKLARQSGEVANVYAHEVCANDKLKITLGTDKKLEHEPNYSGDRGEVVFYYAVVEFKDGSKDFEPMSLKEIHRIRDRSDGWKAYKAGKIKSTPWGTDEAEMAKKTCLRRLLKRIPQSPELADAFRIEDADYGAEELPARPSLASRFSTAKTPPSPEGFSAEHVEREIGSSPSVHPEQEQDPESEIVNAEQETLEVKSETQDSNPAAAEPQDERAGDDPVPSSVVVGASPELFQGYSRALHRAGKKDSLKTAATAFWKTQEVKATDLDVGSRGKLEKIWAAHEERIDGKLAGPALDKRVTAIVEGV